MFSCKIPEDVVLKGAAMPKYSKSEFIEMLGLTHPALSTYIKRESIVVNSDNMIDDKHRTNADFIQKRLAKIQAGKVKVQKKPTGSNAPIDPVEVVELEAPPVKQSRKLKKAEEETRLTLYNLTLQKSQADVEKKLVDTELAKVKLNVLQGGNIPVQYVKTILATFSKTILVDYKAFQDQLIAEFCHRNKIPDIDRSQMLSKSLTELNSIHLKAITETKNQLKNAIGTNQTMMAHED